MRAVWEPPKIIVPMARRLKIATKVDRALWLFAAAILALGLALALGVTGRPGLGPLRIAMLGLGLWVATGAACSGRARVRRAMLQMTIVAGSVYGSLLLCEAALWGASQGRAIATKNCLLGLHGFSLEDPQVGYRHVPGARAHYDDGVVEADYVINARGDRDDDAPVEGADTRIVLLGDSFTFGQALPRAATIEAQLERAGQGAWDVYNLGVSGYATTHIRQRFLQSAWWRGEHVVYLFFNNDVHPDSAQLDAMRVHEGYVVPRYDADGRVLTEAQLSARLHQALQQPMPSTGAHVRAALQLRRLRTMLARAADRELRLTGLPAAALDLDVVATMAVEAAALRAEAARRGAQFHVVVIPTAAEVREAAWSTGTAAFVEAAGEQGLAPDTGLLQTLNADSDYLDHDGHFAGPGAAKAAAHIATLLRLRP